MEHFLDKTQEYTQRNDEGFKMYLTGKLKNISLTLKCVSTKENIIFSN